MARSKSLGINFPDEIRKVTWQTGHFKKTKGLPDGWTDQLIPNFNPDNDSHKSVWRTTILIGLSALFFFSLFIRLFHLQVSKGAENRSLADGNRIQVKLIHAPRGVIFDRNGKVLAKNEPGFRLTKDNKITYISRDEALKAEALNLDLNNLEIDNIRSFPYSEKTAHILGYVSEITEEELKDPKYKGYRAGDRVGRGGIEEAYEKDLKGVDGGEIIEVDAAGQKVRTVRKIESIPGNNLYLSVDSDLQIFSYDKLSEAVTKAKSCCGALVVSNPQTGEILSMVSVPSFNPVKINEALVAENSPLLNRAISGNYPPGSTFKIASALAGLESGKVTKSTIFEDTGVIKLGPFEFNNWYFTQHGKTEGAVDIIKALQRSNDIYFYQLGQLSGEKILGDYSKKLGLGQKSGIEIPGESAGLIPDNDWKVKNIGDVWYPGDTLHMAIGQGFVLSTPLQINNLTSIVAADGNSYIPHFAVKLSKPDGTEVKNFDYQEKKVNFKKENIEIVKTGLSEVPKNGGTAWPFFNFPIATAGKTGTAEYGAEEKTHAWYTAYAPVDDPKIAMTVLIEGGGEGSTVASPVVKETFRWFFSENKRSLIPDLGAVASDSARILGE